MKKSKRIISIALALIIALSVFAVSTSVTAGAIGKTTLTTAVYNADATITLGWTAASGANRYQIARKMIYDSSYTYTVVNTTTYHDINLVYGTIFYYQIRPMYVKGKSVSYGAWSSTKSVTTLYKPTVTSMNLLNKNLLNINWNKIMGVTHYKVAFKRTTDIAWNYREVKTNYYNVPNPTNGAKYVVQVCPIAGKISGPWSAAKTKDIAYFSKPVIKSAGLAAWYNDLIVVSYTVDGPAERFILYYKRAQDSGWSSINTSQISEIIDGVEPNTTYYFQVRALSIDGIYSPYSDVKSFTTPAES